MKNAKLKDKYRQTQINADKRRQIQTNLDKYRQITTHYKLTMQNLHDRYYKRNYCSSGLGSWC